MRGPAANPELRNAPRGSAESGTARDLHHRNPARCAPPAFLLTALAGCESYSGLQSPMFPRGSAADAIAEMAWVGIIGGIIVLTMVVLFIGYTFVTRTESRPNIKPGLFVLGGGVIFPVVVMTGWLAWSLPVGSRIAYQAAEDRLVVEVVGHQWWWEVRYVGESPERDVITANELHLPVDRPVELLLTSSDVIHSFWVPNIAGKMDMVPGQVNRMVVTATEPGFAWGQCNEYCGAQHARMRLMVVMQSQADFERWLEEQRLPAQAPTDPLAIAGQAALLGSGCPMCHTIRGTGATGRVAPELTHVGGRRTIAAGTLPNTLGNRQAWIARAQHFKPEARMPNFNEFDGDTLRAIAYYLGTLQ